MTSMPDAVSAPPRPAPTQRGGSPGDDARDEDFASLVDGAAEEEPDDAARPDRLRKRKESRADDPVAAQGAITQAVVQASGTDAPLMPWLVAAAPAAPATAVPTATVGKETMPGSAAPQAAGPTGDGKHPAGQTAATAPATALQPTPASSAPDAPAGKSGSAAPASADAAAQDSTGRVAEAPASSQTVQAGLPAMATAAPDATAEAPPSADGRQIRRDESSDPRTAVRSAHGAGRQGTAAGKAEQTAGAPAAPQSAQPGQPTPDAATALAGRDPAPPFSTPPTAGSGDAAATGFEAVPTLPAQAATHYAVAAASGRAATAHSPAMAQLAAPLVRVAENGGGEFHIDLAPAELGRIRVVADVSDGKVSLTVQAEQADTLALLRRDLTQLERALGDAGLSLDSSSLQFSLQGDGQSRGFAAPDRGGSSGGWSVQAGAVPEHAAEPVTDRPLRPIDGLVDVTV
ncbi:Flagellar hook-length control protein FliK [Azospirillum oryzae]|uniref:Flagellar hook-length control protein FliK n=1 Tax=Azospirillum oryzae TaxID=286727 RepID=A0A1X7HJG4_9PROT|nr:flagellar hook-length control protein FliK [Azospirillum oryzae]SMF86803.1 Flagellar hook-length control protein FliK [Azospirillum oryzae]